MKGLSVIICCYNSASRLPKTIEYLALQKDTSDFPWEIIIVDNASTDNTEEVALQEWKRQKLVGVTLKVIKENQPGLSYARSRGVIEAEFDYILFCDDDNYLEFHYLKTAFQLIDRNPKIGALGGQSYAVGEVELPDWFEEHKQSYAVGKQNEVTGDITARGIVWGAGMVTRRELYLETINDTYPSLLSDRKGKELTSGGDYEYCIRLVLKKYELYYDERLVFGHFIPKARLTETYLNRLLNGFKASDYYMNIYRESVSVKFSAIPLKLKWLTGAMINVFQSLFTKSAPRGRSLRLIYYFTGIKLSKDEALPILKHFYKY